MFRAVVPHSGVHQRIASEHGTGRMAEKPAFPYRQQSTRRPPTNRKQPQTTEQSPVPAVTSKYLRAIGLRCKLEVYSKTTDLRVAQAQLFIDDNSGLTGAITFPDVHLPPNDTYKAICWADYIAAGTETDLIYNTSKGLKRYPPHRNNRHRSCGNRRQRSGYRRCLCRTIRNFHHRSKRCCQRRG